jgi:putative NADH-flavin reductase
MNILVFGATGGSGKEFVQQALQKGHKITTIVRNPEKFDLQNRLLKVVKGDVMQPETIAKELAGIDVVVSALGVHSREPTTLFSQGASNILEAMETHRIRRFMCISAQAVVISPNIALWQKLFTKYILQPILKHQYADTLRMEEIVRRSNLDWTIIRPPQLKDKPLTANYRVAINSFLKSPPRISRADLAHFMVDHLTDSSTFQAVIEITY